VSDGVPARVRAQPETGTVYRTYGVRGIARGTMLMVARVPACGIWTGVLLLPASYPGFRERTKG